MFDIFKCVFTEINIIFFFLCNLTSDDDEEEGEGYLDIVPDTNPEDVVNEVKQSTLSRSVQ